MIEYWIDIPNVETVNLPNSFRNVLSRSINSMLVNMNEWLDVSPILANLVPFSLNDIESLDSNITSITIPNYSLNNEDYTIFNFSRFNLLEELIIGDDSFMYVNEFVINELNELKSLVIGMNSFTKKKNSYGDDESRSFSILNCIELKSIEIGENSFSDYGGEFELFNLPKLESIKIGLIENWLSLCFWGSSFIIQGFIDNNIDNE